MSATSLSRTKLSYGTGMCWQASLASFGIELPLSAADRRHDAMTIGLAIVHMIRRGYECTAVAPGPGWWEAKSGVAYLGRFIAEHPTGDYILVTQGHMMALRDGQLTDTDTTATGRRHVLLAYHIERKV